jgi:deoxyribonuclease V
LGLFGFAEMILAFDAYYFDGKAKTVCICFENWTDAKPLKIFSAITENIADYASGAFYKRELPCILDLLKKVDAFEIEAIIVDGYVVLDDDGNYGLGGYLFEQLDNKTPVIGVAKTNFALIEKNKCSVLRGQSARPLYITSLGIDADIAAQQIQCMHGEFRMPSLLKQLDALTKEK